MNFNFARLVSVERGLNPYNPGRGPGTALSLGVPRRTGAAQSFLNTFPRTGTKQGIQEAGLLLVFSKEITLNWCVLRYLRDGVVSIRSGSNRDCCYSVGRDSMQCSCG